MRQVFDNDRLYFPEGSELRLFGTGDKLAQWRHRRRGPAFLRIERRIAYHGSDLNAYLNAQRVDPSITAA